MLFTNWIEPIYANIILYEAFKPGKDIKKRVYNKQEMEDLLISRPLLKLFYMKNNEDDEEEITDMDSFDESALKTVVYYGKKVYLKDIILDQEKIIRYMLPEAFDDSFFNESESYYISSTGINDKKKVRLSAHTDNAIIREKEISLNKLNKEFLSTKMHYGRLVSLLPICEYNIIISDESSLDTMVKIYGEDLIDSGTYLSDNIEKFRMLKLFNLDLEDEWKRGSTIGMIRLAKVEYN